MTITANTKLNNINRIFWAICALLICITAGQAFALPVYADSNTQGQDKVGFHVSAVIPENQIDKKKTFFDLRMKPGAKQTLRVNLISDSKSPQTVEISAISASTNRNGVIDYRTPNIKDKTLRVPFSEIASVSKKTITIPAGGTAVAETEVNMPTATFDGTVLGGIVITRAAKTGESNSKPDTDTNDIGTSIINEYSYVIGVKLSETNKTVLPDFEYDKVEAGLTNYYPAYIHYIRNKEAVIVKDMAITVKIYKQGEQSPCIDFKGTVDMAPNSVMPIGTETKDGKLGSGRFKSKVRLVHNKKVWEFEKDFTVSEDEAAKVEDDSALSMNTEKKEARPWLTAAIVGAVLLILLALLLLLFLLMKRRRDEEEDDDIPPAEA